MRTEREIWEKLDEYATRARGTTCEDEKEILLTVVDTLLWVLGDESGKPI